MILDSQKLIGATRNGHAIKTYDDGFGPLWISRDSMGICGIVRARTWYDANDICEDEFFPEASETLDEMRKEYGYREINEKVVRDTAYGVHTEIIDRDGFNFVFNLNSSERLVRDSDYSGGSLPEGLFLRWKSAKVVDPDSFSENDCWAEAYGFRPNGPNATDTINHGIYAKDMSGDYLEPLTQELAAELDIVLELKDEEE